MRNGNREQVTLSRSNWVAIISIAVLQLGTVLGYVMIRESRLSTLEALVGAMSKDLDELREDIRELRKEVHNGRRANYGY